EKRCDADISVEVATIIGETTAAPRASRRQDCEVRANAFSIGKLHIVTATDTSDESCRASLFQLSSGILRREGQGFVERATVEVQRQAIGGANMLSRRRNVAAPNRQDFRRVA